MEQKWKSEGLVEEIGRGAALLGYCVLAQQALILLATQVQPTLELPGCHVVYTIQQSEWRKVNLQIPSPTPTPQQDEYIAKITRMIQSFPLSSTHFYCDTVDITRPFPSEYAPTQPCWEFVWNKWLSAPIRDLELDCLCPPLLQGLAQLKVMQDLNQKAFSIAMISRRSRLHAGTRYNARGLNCRACPGNELEVKAGLFEPSTKKTSYDLLNNMRIKQSCRILHDNIQAQEPHRKKSEYQLKQDWDIEWSRHVHRRGTVPIWWSVQLKNSGIGEAEIRINQSKGDVGRMDTKRYFRRLQKRYAAPQKLGTQYYFGNDNGDDDYDENEDNNDDDDDDQNANNDYEESESTWDNRRGPDPPTQEENVYSQSNENNQENEEKNDFGEDQRRESDNSQQERRRRGLDKSYDLSIINVNLLRKNAFDKQEQKLSFSYAETIQWLRSEKKMAVNICNFDWHDLVGQVQLPSAVEYLWLLLANEIKSQGFAKGVISKFGQSLDPQGKLELQYGRDLKVTYFQHQQGVLRFNCADSLDRTNLAAYYACLQIMVEQCRSIGLYTSYNQPNKEYLRDCPALTFIFNQDQQTQAQEQSQLQQIKQQNAQNSALSQFRKGMQGLGMRVFGNKNKARTPGMTQTVYQPQQLVTPPEGNLAQINSEYLASSNQNDYRTEQQLGNESLTSQLQKNGQQVAQQQKNDMQKKEGSRHGSSNGQDTEDDALPEGWEKRWMPDKNCYIYLDHVTKTTHWSPPGSSKKPQVGATESETLPQSTQSPQRPPPTDEDLLSSEYATIQGNKNKSQNQNSEGGYEGENEDEVTESENVLVKDSYLVDENGQTSMISHQQIPLHLDKNIQQNITDPQKLELNDRPWGLIQALLAPSNQVSKYSSVQAFALQVQPQLLSRVAELFVMNGNVNAALYTGSDAMHLDKILLFESEGSPLRLKFSAQNNAYIAIIRRYNNLWSDQDKQLVTQLFLGENLGKAPFVKHQQEDDSLLEFPDSDKEEYEELSRLKEQTKSQQGNQIQPSNNSNSNSNSINNSSTNNNSVHNKHNTNPNQGTSNINETPLSPTNRNIPNNDSSHYKQNNSNNKINNNKTNDNSIVDNKYRSSKWLQNQQQQLTNLDDVQQQSIEYSFQDQQEALRKLKIQNLKSAQNFQPKQLLQNDLNQQQSDFAYQNQQLTKKSSSQIVQNLNDFRNIIESEINIDQNLHLSQSWPCIHNYLGDFHDEQIQNNGAVPIVLDTGPSTNNKQRKQISEITQQSPQFPPKSLLPPKTQLAPQKQYRSFTDVQQQNQLPANQPQQYAQQTNNEDNSALQGSSSNQELRYLYTTSTNKNTYPYEGSQQGRYPPFSNVKLHVPSYSSSNSSQRENSFSVVHFENYIQTPNANMQRQMSGHQRPYEFPSQTHQQNGSLNNRSTLSSQGHYSSLNQHPIGSQQGFNHMGQDIVNDVFEQYSIITTNDMNDSITSRIVDLEYTELNRLESGRSTREYYTRECSGGRENSLTREKIGVSITHSINNSQNATHNSSSNNTDLNGSFQSGGQNSSRGGTTWPTHNDSINSNMDLQTENSQQQSLSKQMQSQQGFLDWEQESPQRYFGFTQSQQFSLAHLGDRSQVGKGPSISNNSKSHQQQQQLQQQAQQQTMIQQQQQHLPQKQNPQQIQYSMNKQNSKKLDEHAQQHQQVKRQWYNQRQIKQQQQQQYQQQTKMKERQQKQQNSFRRSSKNSMVGCNDNLSQTSEIDNSPVAS